MANYDGQWWNAPAGSEAGWGINFAHQGEVIFATWFTHDANGNAWYMSMTALQTGPATFAGTLYSTTGPPLGANPFDPNQVQRIAVGSANLTFSDGNNGTFAYTVNGISQTKPITRQVFGPLPACTWGGLANLALATNYQGLWWAVGGVESGWGINFTHQGDVIFATWFTYDFTGAALPLSGTLTKVGPGTYSGSLIKTSGPAFYAVPFDPNAVTASRSRHRHGDVQRRQCCNALLSGKPRRPNRKRRQDDPASGVPRTRHRVPVMPRRERAP